MVFVYQKKNGLMEEDIINETDTPEILLWNEYFFFI